MQNERGWPSSPGFSEVARLLLSFIVESISKLVSSTNKDAITKSVVSHLRRKVKWSTALQGLSFTLLDIRVLWLQAWSFHSSILLRC